VPRHKKFSCAKRKFLCIKLRDSHSLFAAHPQAFPQAARLQRGAAMSGATLTCPSGARYMMSRRARRASAQGSPSMTPAERPLSPFQLGTIYRLQLTSALSFTHRVTGVALTIGTVFLVWWLVAAASSEQSFAAAQWFFGSWLGLLLLLGWCFAFFFHLCNGIRHLFWDAGMGFELKAAYASGWTVMAASIVLTIIAYAAGLLVRG
jgi:succinate dehydrogenase / fumarate reductase cytochrome b subunit